MKKDRPIRIAAAIGLAFTLATTGISPAEGEGTPIPDTTCYRDEHDNVYCHVPTRNGGIELRRVPAGPHQQASQAYGPSLR